MNKKMSGVVFSCLMVSSLLAGCGSSDNSIHLQLVPSNDPATLLPLGEELAPILDKYAPGYTFTVDVGATYEATMISLSNGQIDGGFLPASNYAQITETKPGTVDVLLSASRAGYKVQADDFPGFTDAAKEEQREAMNGEITATGEKVTSANASDAYVYRGQQSDTQVSYYSGIMFCLRDSVRKTVMGDKYFPLDLNGDGTVTVQELHDAGATVGHMSATSSSGYVYPTKMLYDMGFTKGFVAADDYSALSAADKALAIKGTDQQTYPLSVENVMNGTLDAACGFMDTRYGSAYVQDASSYKGDDSLFTDTYTVAITDPIMNDTVSVNASLSQAKRDAISTALKAAVKDGDKDTAGTGAYLLYQIYSHTGYVDAVDSNYDAARSMYEWSVAHTAA